MLPLAVAPEPFESSTPEGSQVVQRGGRVERVEQIGGGSVELGGEGAAGVLAVDPVVDVLRSPVADLHVFVSVSRTDTHVKSFFFITPHVLPTETPD